MNQQLFPASFRSKPFSLSTTETCLSLLRDPASCKNGWQSRRLSSAAGHSSLFNVQSKQMTISHTQFLSCDGSSNCCALVTCARNHWPHTHCRHVLKKKHCLLVASCPVQNYQHQCALPFLLVLEQCNLKRLSQWQAIRALGQNSGHYPLQLIAQCSSSKQVISKQPENIVQCEQKAKETLAFWGGWNAQNVRGDVMTSAMIIDHDSDTQKMCACIRRESERRITARRCSNSGRAALFYKQRRTLTRENKFHRRGVLWTPPNQARFRHVRVGKMHRDGGVRHAIVFKMPLQRLHSCVPEENER